MLPRTSEFHGEFKELWDKFHKDAYNGRQNARGILKELEVLLRKHFVSRGMDPSQVLRKLSAVDNILYRNLSDRGTSRGLDRTLRELSLEIDKNKTRGMNPIHMLNEYMKEFSSAWRIFNRDREDDSNAEIVQAILDDINDLGPVFAKFQLKNGIDGLYNMFHEASKAGGKIRQGIAAISGYQTIPQSVHKDAADFLEKLSGIVTYRPELVHLPSPDKEEEEESSDPNEELHMVPGKDGKPQLMTLDKMIKFSAEQNAKKEAEAEKSGAAEKKPGSEPEDSSADSGEPEDPEEEEAEDEN